MDSLPRPPTHTRRLAFLNNVIYELFPGAYNALDWLTFGAWWRLVSRALDYIPAGGRVLEIGFGPGRLHLELARRARQCVGLDLAWGMCWFTQRRLRRSGLTAQLVRGSAFNLPFPDNAFDIVVSTFALSGIPDIQLPLSEIARVTSPGGRVVIVDIRMPENRRWMGIFFARLWQSFGDFLYDFPQQLRAVGFEKLFVDEFGPGDHIHAVVGEKPGR